MMYFIAKSENVRKDWIETFRIGRKCNQTIVTNFAT